MHITICTSYGLYFEHVYIFLNSIHSGSFKNITKKNWISQKRGSDCDQQIIPLDSESTPMQCKVCFQYTENEENLLIWESNVRQIEVGNAIHHFILSHMQRWRERQKRCAFRFITPFSRKLQVTQVLLQLILVHSRDQRRICHIYVRLWMHAIR